MSQAVTRWEQSQSQEMRVSDAWVRRSNQAPQRSHREVGMNLRIAHRTHYAYPLPAWDSFNEVWVCPVDDDRQSRLDFHLTVSPDCAVREREDYYGNRVHDFHLFRGHDGLTVMAISQVTTFITPLPEPVSFGMLAQLRPRFFEFLAPTSRMPVGGNWAKVFGVDLPEPNDDLATYLDQITRHLYDTLHYEPNVTNVNTSVAEIASLRAGVCQDFATAMLAVCRDVGIPSRYVSGYLHVGVGCEGSHAWVEAFLPGSGWMGFDPTNGLRATHGYVKVAHGRDYDDCPPMRGLRRGGGDEVMTVSVTVEAL